MWFVCQWDRSPPETKWHKSIFTSGQCMALNNEQNPYCLVSYKRPRNYEFQTLHSLTFFPLTEGDLNIHSEWIHLILTFKDSLQGRWFMQCICQTELSPIEWRWF